MPVPSDMAQECRAIRVRGLVQGVGFRPFAYRLAHDLGLAGWVFNDADGVAIEVQGAVSALTRFEQRLKTDAPPMARVVEVQAVTRPRSDRLAGFRILPSRPGPVTTAVAPDAATCDDCLAELFDAGDRRHRYAFINCTQCGPRYTLTRHLPYDRAHTSMAASRNAGFACANTATPCTGASTPNRMPARPAARPSPWSMRRVAPSPATP